MLNSYQHMNMILKYIGLLLYLLYFIFDTVISLLLCLVYILNFVLDFNVLGEYIYMCAYNYIYSCSKIDR